jgi:hypothetical protein
MKRASFSRYSDFERSHIDGEAVLHIGFGQSLVGFVDLLDGDDFDVGGNVVLTAEVEHLLGLCDTPDERAREAAASEDEAEDGDGQRLFRRAHHGDVAVAAEEVDVGVDVVFGGDGVEDEIETAGVLRHLIRVTGDDDLIGSEAKGVVPLAGRSGEHHNMRSESVGELDAHVAESTETDHPDLLALGYTPVPHGRVGGDSGAEERSGSSKIEVRRNAEHEALVDDDAVGVAAVRDAPGVLVGEVVGEGHVGAELLEAGLALGASAVGVHQAADCGEVAGLELGYRGADLCDAAHDFMAGNAGVHGRHETAPLVAGLVEIGVADPAEEDLYLDVVFGGIASHDRGRSKRRCRVGNGISFCFVHKVTLTSALSKLFIEIQRQLSYQSNQIGRLGA